MWDLIVSVPDHCLSFYFGFRKSCTVAKVILSNLRSWVIVGLNIFFVC